MARQPYHTMLFSPTNDALDFTGFLLFLCGIEKENMRRKGKKVSEKGKKKKEERRLECGARYEG